MTEKREEDKIVQSASIGHELEGLVNKRESFTGEIPEDHFFDSYNDDKFREIMEEQMDLIKLLKRYDQPKYLANRILIIFDDLVPCLVSLIKVGGKFFVCRKQRKLF